MKKKVIILLTNPLEMDNRVYNEAKALMKAGFEVVVYAWDRERRYSDKVDGTVEGIKVSRVLIKSSYGQGPRQLFAFVCFWITVFFRLIKYNFDIVHCVDLNSLAAGFMAAKIRRKKIVYDSHEDFPAAMLDAKVKHLASLAEKVEAFMIKRIDLVITVSEQIKDILVKRGARKIEVVPTTKPLSEYKYTEDERLNLRKKLGLEGKFVFLYLGLLYHHRNLLEIIKIFKESVVKTAVFLIGGYGSLEEKIKEETKGSKNVIFIGRVLASEMSLYTVVSDVVFALNRSTSKNLSATLPNKLFEAIAAAKPIIVSNIGPRGRIVKERGCGLAVNPDNLEDVKKAILRLISDKALYSKLQQNASQAQGVYNWEATSKILIEAYRKL